MQSLESPKNNSDDNLAVQEALPEQEEVETAANYELKVVAESQKK